MNGIQQFNGIQPIDLIFSDMCTEPEFDSPYILGPGYLVWIKLAYFSSWSRKNCLYRHASIRFQNVLRWLHGVEFHRKLRINLPLGLIECFLCDDLLCFPINHNYLVMWRKGLYFPCNWLPWPAYSLQFVRSCCSFQQELRFLQRLTLNTMKNDWVIK